MTEPAPLPLETITKMVIEAGPFLAGHLDAFEAREAVDPINPDDRPRLISNFMIQNFEFMALIVQATGIPPEELENWRAFDIATRAQDIGGATIAEHGLLAIEQAIYAAVEPFRLPLSATVH